MPTDLTGTPTALGIGTYNVSVDAPSGLGFNAAMAQIDALIGARAALNSPAFTGTPTAPTPATNDNSTKIATTAWVKSQTLVNTVNGRSGAVVLTASDYQGPIFLVTDSFGVGGDSVIPNYANGPVQIWTVTQVSGAPQTFTMNAPSNPPDATHTGALTIVIKTGAGSVPFNISWVGFKTNGFTLPTSSASAGSAVNVTFFWDGLFWVCLCTPGNYTGGNG